MSKEIQIVSPAKAILPALTSASAHIVSRSLQEQRPQANVDFSYSTNKRIIIDISSPSAMVDFSNSYLRFNLTCTLKNDGVNSVARYLPEGGAQALFKTIILQTASGTEISRIDRANHLSVIMRSMGAGDEYIDSVLHREGDGVGVANFGVYVAIRELAANTADYTICMQPFGPFLDSEQLFPLMMIRGGIRLTLELEDPVKFLISSVAPTGAGFSDTTYTIKNPVYCLDYVTPSTDLFQVYKDKFMSEGIAYPFMQFKTYSEIATSGSGSHTMTLQPSFRSARIFISQIQDLRAETITAGDVNGGKSSYCVDSIAQGLRAHLSEFSLRSGSENFPLQSPLIVDASCNELMIQAERALGHLSFVNSRRGVPQERQAYSHLLRPLEQGATAGKAEAMRLYELIDLSRDQSHLSGLDLSLNTLQATYKFNATYNLTNLDGTSSTASNRYIHAWIGGDSILSISSRAVSTFV